MELLVQAARWTPRQVVCDRYAYSGVAYSVAKGMDLDWSARGEGSAKEIRAEQACATSHATRAAAGLGGS